MNSEVAPLGFWGWRMRKVIFCMVFILLGSTSFAADRQIAFIPGTGGDLNFASLYSVDYKCRLDSSRADALIRSLIDVTDSLFGVGTLNENVSMFSSSAAAAPTIPAAGATRTPVFSSNVATLRFRVFHATEPEGRPCAGQFFISGAENYTVEAQLGVNVTNRAAEFFASLTALTLSTATNLYALFKAQPPPELAASVNNASGLLTNYINARNLFGASAAVTKSDSGQLRIGKNVVHVYDGDRNVVSSIEMFVKPVNSLVMDGHTKFLAAYYAVSNPNGAAITVTGTDDAIRGQCALATQSYYSAGIADDRDVAFLLYRRLILADNSTDKIAKCLGPTIARSALTIMGKLQRLEPRYRITSDDIKNLAPNVASDQPHNRPTLPDEMDSFTDILARHLQSDGLRGPQLSKLLGYFAPMTTIEDQTANYKVLKLLYPDVTSDTSKTLSRDEMLASFKDKGLKRWLCVQRTKANTTPVVPLYDAEIDSAVMVIVAKAEANEVLDKNKSTLYGVHIKFNKAFNSEPLVINKLVFEERRRDTILKVNPTCIPDVAARPGA
jgi:hypothetical protein